MLHREPQAHGLQSNNEVAYYHDDNVSMQCGKTFLGTVEHILTLRLTLREKLEINPLLLLLNTTNTVLKIK